MKTALQAAATSAPARRRSSRNVLLARLHCIKHERAWSDDEYRDILQALTGQRSAADLDLPGLTRAIAVLGQASVRVPQPEGREVAAESSEWAFITRATPDKRPLLRKIAATCTALDASKAYAEAIAKRQSGGIERRLEMCSFEELYKIVGALSRTQQYRQRQAEKAGGKA